MTEVNPLVDQYREKIGRTVLVAFPTMGHFYHDGVMRPGTKFTEITVYPLGTEAELLLKDPILMASGRSVPKMITALVPQVVIPEELSDIDIEVLLIAVRLASYGPDLKVEHTCANPEKVQGGVGGDIHVCREENTIVLNLIEHIQKYVPIENWDQYRMEFDLGEGSKQVVLLRRVPYRSVLNGVRNSLMAEGEMEQFKDKNFDELILSEDSLSAYEKMTELLATTNLDSLLDAIVGVEMIRPGQESKTIYTSTHPQMVQEWLWKIPSEWVGRLNERVIGFSRELSKLNEMKYECPHCKFKNEFQLQLDVNKLFFSGRQPSSPPESPSPISPEPIRSKPKRRSRTSMR